MCERRSLYRWCSKYFKIDTMSVALTSTIDLDSNPLLSATTTMISLFNLILNFKHFLFFFVPGELDFKYLWKKTGVLDTVEIETENIIKVKRYLILKFHNNSRSWCSWMRPSLVKVFWPSLLVVLLLFN